MLGLRVCFTVIACSNSSGWKWDGPGRSGGWLCGRTIHWRSLCPLCISRPFSDWVSQGCRHWVVSKRRWRDLLRNLSMTFADTCHKSAWYAIVTSSPAALYYCSVSVKATHEEAPSDWITPGCCCCFQEDFGCPLAVNCTPYQALVIIKLIIKTQCWYI